MGPRLRQEQHIDVCRVDYTEYVSKDSATSSAASDEDVRDIGTSDEDLRGHDPSTGDVEVRDPGGDKPTARSVRTGHGAQPGVPIIPEACCGRGCTIFF